MKRRTTDHPTGAVLRVGRLRLTSYIFSLLFVLLLVRLFYLQILKGENYAQIAREQHTQKVAVESHRGRILDRSGQEMAVDLPQYYSVGVFPAQLRAQDSFCQKLASLTGRPAWHYQRRLESRSKFLYLEWRLQKDQAEELQRLNLAGVVLNKTASRFYPYDRATAQLLGYTDVNNHGISGLELYCDSLLQGSKGWEMRQRNATGVSFWDPLKGSISPQDGGTIRLSIDVVAQEILHQELEAAICSTRAQWVAGILLDPRSGEILAISSVPDYDPLHPEQGDKVNHKLRPLTDLLEPGSVFKIVAATAALDQNLARPSDMFYCENGRYTVGDHILGDAHPYGSLSFEDILVHSSNIGMAKVGERIGARELYRYCVRFGFGNPACVEFPGEATGKLRPYDQWRDIGRANVSIGQGIAVTMLQMALAYGAIANDGIMMEPRLILDVTEADGRHRAYPPCEVRRVMEPETAWTLQRILAQVVERGTGKAAALDTVTVIAGKTGTAQLPNLVTGGYYQDRYLASFIGFMPAYHADRLLLISVCDPQGAYYGAQVAAPVFRRVLTRLQPADAVRRSREIKPLEVVELPAQFKASAKDPSKDTSELAAMLGPALLNIANFAPSVKTAKPAALNTIPDLIGLTLREAIKLLTARGVEAQISGSGKVVSQSLAPGSPVFKNSACFLIATSHEAPTDSLAACRSDSGQPVAQPD